MGKKGQIVLNLQERTLTAEEWKELLPEAEKEAEEVFRNGQQADHVSGQVVLCERVKNGLISVEWKLEPDIWIDLQGNIEEENLLPGQVVMLPQFYRMEKIRQSIPFLSVFILQKIRMKPIWGKR